MVITRGTRTKNAYIIRAGKANSQPTKVSRWTRLLWKFHREFAIGLGRLSDVSIDIMVDRTGAGIVLLH
jgi:hypothetical protein